MKIDSIFKQFTFFSVITVLIFFILAFLWYIHFPFDEANGDFGAVHIVFNIIAAIAGIITGFLTICSLFYNKDEWDPDDSFIISKKIIILPFIAVIFLILCGFIISPFNKMTEIYNKHIEYKNQYEKIEYERKSYFDKMWKTYLQKNNICEINKDAFIETTKIIMEGRHDGEQVAWKWVHENQNIPYKQFTSFYFNLSIFVHEQREGYYNLEKQAMEIVQKNNTMLDIFPNNVYNKVLNIEHMQFTPGFTSTYTDKVFDTKHEDIIK